MSDRLYKTIKYRGFSINIHCDNMAENPANEWYMLGTIVNWGKYIIGKGENVFNCANGAIEHILSDLGIEYSDDDIEYDDAKELWNKYAKRIQEKAVILPIYIYDHSGITINTQEFHCQWDSGQIGFVYVSKEAVKKEWEWKLISKKRREHIEGILKANIAVIDDYLRGNVFGYMIEPMNANNKIECDDSCCGYYGNDMEKNGLLETAKGQIRWCIEHYRTVVKERYERGRQMDSFMRNHWAC